MEREEGREEEDEDEEEEEKKQMRRFKWRGKGERRKGRKGRMRVEEARNIQRTNPKLARNRRSRMGDAGKRMRNRLIVGVA